MDVFTTVPSVELLRRRRNSQKAQAAAEFMVRGEHLSVESPVHYHDLAELIEDDPRNLKKILDSYPGFVRLAGKPLYFYLPEFYGVAEALGNGLHYPTELPYSISRRGDIPKTVSSHAAPVEILQTPEPPKEVVATKVYGAPDTGKDNDWITVRFAKLSEGIKTNADIIQTLADLTEAVQENMTLGSDGKLPGSPESRIADLNTLLGFVATLTRMADR